MVGMPQITVEYSESLTDTFDRRGFALALHTAAQELLGSAPTAFKTRFRTTGETVIGDGDPNEAMVHVGLAILPGRDAETKAKLGELTQTLLAAHLKPAADLNTQLTVEIRDLADAYSKTVIARA
jgi:5-carboxymethyl-2-hydroxymuconate isomerase